MLCNNAAMTNEQLAAIGDLSINFSALDESVNFVLCKLLRCPDEDAAALMIGGLSFGARVERIRLLVRYYATTHGLAKSDTVKRFNETIAQIVAISEERNRLIHTYIRFDPDRQFTVFLIDSKSGVRIDAEPEQIKAISARAFTAAVALLPHVQQLLKNVPSAKPAS